jgi:hypothetical protein
MIKFIVMICAVVLPICTFSQNSKANQPSKTESKQQTSEGFDKYCLNNATSLMQNSAAKSIKYAGTIQKLKGNKVPTFKECGITLKENETQYFKIEGSDQILAVKSLFVLRLNHKNSKK